MKMTKLFAAIGLTVAAMGVGGAAQAHDRWDDGGWRHEHHWDDDRSWDNDRRWDRDRRWAYDRRWNRDWRWERHYGRERLHCWTEWYHHRRVRVCR